jgi:threonine dehydrogenase-like Zn-dependent dehydrogenase
MAEFPHGEMKELMIHDGPRVEPVKSPIPVPKDDEVVIKVAVAGCNPKDYKVYWVPKPINQGDDMAGTVHQVGANVTEFRPGDRVFALHQIQAPHGAYAEYAVASAATTAHLARKTSFEEAATIPLAATTAALALYRELGLPPPWAPRALPLPGPLLIYGGSTAVGAFAIKLARAANLHPIVAVAGGGLDLVASLLDPAAGDVALDYRNGPEQLRRDMAAALRLIACPGDRATEDLAKGEHFEIISRNDAEVAGSALQRPEQIGGRLGVDVDEGAVGKDHLVVEHVVSRPPALAREVTQTATEDQGAPDAGHAAASDSEAILFEERVHILPAECRAGADVVNAIRVRGADERLLEQVGGGHHDAVVQ